MNPHERILRAAQSEVWGMLPDRLDAMFAFLELRAQGHHSDPDTVAKIHAAAELQAARASSLSQSGGSVAVIPMFGTILPRGNMMSDLSGPGCCSATMVASQVQSAVDDPNVSGIVLAIDSPGGSVAGIQELFDVVFAARGKKQVIAVSEYLCASAALYVAAAASEVWVSPSSQTGSIGVFSKHTNIAGALEKAGVQITLVSYGANKTAGNELGPLEGDALADMQATVDYYGGQFDKAMAKGRGVTTAQVRSKFGQGKIFNAADAVSIGLADKIGTLQDVLGKKFGMVRQSGGASARLAASVKEPTIEGSATRMDKLRECREPLEIKAADTADCPRGDDCPAQEDDIDDSADCPADGCPLKDGADAKAKACAAHAHRTRMIQIANI